MYQRHFALTRYPFEPTIKIDELYCGSAQQEAAARLRQLTEMRGGIGLLTGEPGCGKTTVCRQLLDTLHSGLYRARYVSLTTGSILDLYNVIADAFGLAFARNRAQAYLSLRSDISKHVAESRQISVLVIDEAHFLRAESLEELRLITNFRMDSEYRMCLLLVGHSELRARLNRAAFESLRQRVTARCHLAGLDQQEVAAYVDHRMKLAGCETPTFESAATEAIVLASGGVPRRIDRLAHLSLTSAAIDSRRMVSCDDVHAAIAEIGQ